ncbi:hypothetical protein GZH49_37130 [Nocardia terpenica]|uniref:Uncharacterized protein n=1 Tax=Nocardia terpenica TaxID=455432 RepID=A0A291RVL1_9NOCA|nr:hypothetical protein CRH09_00335 [Nocardia terpenica]
MAVRFAAAAALAVIPLAAVAAPALADTPSGTAVDWDGWHHHHHHHWWQGGGWPGDDWQGGPGPIWPGGPDLPSTGSA